jgi:hypothetical protein
MTDELAAVLRGDCVAECIVTTYDPDGRPRAAPMGVRVPRPDELTIRPYRSSRTCRNLRQRRAAVVGVTDDPELFYRTALKGIVADVPEAWFCPADQVDAPRLRSLEAYLEVKVDALRDVSKARVEAVCSPAKTCVPLRHPRAYSRADFAVIESVVHATRVGYLRSIGRDVEASRLEAYIHHYFAIVQRVCPHSPALRMMEGLLAWVQQGAPLDAQGEGLR